MSNRDPDVWNGAVEILAAVKAVPPRYRFDAFVLACDAFFKTSGILDARAAVGLSRHGGPPHEH